MNYPELFWNATLDELQKGYILLKDEEAYICLCCHEVYELGIIYQKNGQFMDAKKAVEYHIKEKHQSMFHYLIEMDKKYTSLTDNQKVLLLQFYEGLSDKEIAKESGSSPSTIRNQRFSFREKAKQAKIYLAIMDLLEIKMKDENKDHFIAIHRTATNIDDRYAITESERVDCLKKYFKDGKLMTFPAKQKRIIIILQYIIKQFDVDQSYTEKEVNSILKTIYDDFVTIRRYLIEYGFLDRKPDGSSYWVKL